MEVVRKHIPEIIPDNEELYFQAVIGVVESVDEFAKLQITKVLNGFQFRLSPSLPKYTPLLIQEMLNLHTYMGMHLDMSKSIKTSSTIAFTVIV